MQSSVNVMFGIAVRPRLVFPFFHLLIHIHCRLLRKGLLHFDICVQSVKTSQKDCTEVAHLSIRWLVFEMRNKDIPVRLLFERGRKRNQLCASFDNTFRTRNTKIEKGTLDIRIVDNSFGTSQSDPVVIVYLS